MDEEKKCKTCKHWKPRRPFVRSCRNTMSEYYGDELRTGGRVMELKDLSGKHILSGVDRISSKGNGLFDPEDGIMFCLDGENYQCFEDPDDGYRSYLRDLATTDEQCRYTFPETEVECYWSDDSGEDDVLTMRETVNGEIVLRIGTWNVDDWYPCCVMEYHPENLPCNKGLEDQA